MAGYTIILTVEPLTNGELAWGAYCPAMPGLVAQGSTRAEVLRNMAELMPMWIDDGLKAGGGPRPETLELLVEAVRDELAWRAEEGLPPNIELVVVEPALVAAA